MSWLVRISIFLMVTISSFSFASHLDRLGQTKNETPLELAGVGVTEHLGENIDLQLTFNDEDGKSVALKNYFDGKRPVLLAMVYFNCANLCNFQMNALNETFQKLDWAVGQQFDVVFVSMDHNETSDIAKAKRENYVKAYGKPESVKGWHLLTGSKENVNKLASQLGFAFKWSEQDKQYLHAAATYVLTPDGKLSRYLYGVGTDPRTLRLSLLEASNGHIGNMVDRFLLFCFHYDPNKKTYAFYAYNIMRAGAATTAILLLLALAPYWWRQRKVKSS